MIIMANDKDFFKIKKMSLKRLLIFQRELEQKYKDFQFHPQAQNSVFAVLCDVKEEIEKRLK